MKKTSLLKLALFPCILWGGVSQSAAYPRANLETVQSVQQEAPTSYRLSGEVRGTNGDPLVGANVIIQGTTGGTTTNLQGAFTLMVSAKDVLEISSLGYTSQQIAVYGKTALSVTLNDSSEVLEQVVVVGYGTQKKANLTGAVDQVTSEVFENRSVSNVAQALMGAVPNLNIDLADGKPIRSASFNIRGTTSVGQGGSALVLIDGVEGDPALLNPNDIASVSVLKDAASSAIYGSRAPFGVVLITTKAPQKGRTSISYTANFTMQQPVDIPDVVSDGYVYASHFLEAYQGWYGAGKAPSKINKSQAFSMDWLNEFKRRKEAGITEEVEVNAKGKYVYYGNTNFYDELYRKITFAHDHNVTINGGNEKADFYLSGRFYDYNGLFKHNSDNYRTMNVRGKGSLQLFKWLRVATNMEYANMTYHNPMNVGEGGGIWRNIADEGHPSSPLFNPDGTYTMTAGYTVADFLYGKNGINTTKEVFKVSPSFKASFFHDTFRVMGDFSFRSTDETQTTKRVPLPYSSTEGIISYLGASTNKLKEGVLNTRYVVANLYAEYEKTFGEKHYVKAMAGGNYERSKYKSIYVERNGLLTPDSENINLALGDLITTSSNFLRWRVGGLFFRMNYAYDDRYLLEVNGRYDGSSKFPNDSQWAFFPSVSAGWRISQEHFWKVKPEAISDLKLRVSYGSLGNNNITPYAFLDNFSISTASIVFNNALPKYTSSPDPIPAGLTWETATTTDIGLDAGFLKSRLRLTADYYIRKTTDMYTVGPTLPDVFGADAPKGNYADMTTKGFEVSLSWRDSFKLGNKPFNYDVKFTLADYISTIDKYNNINNSLDDYYEGQRLGEIWGYQTDGLFQSQEEIDNWATGIPLIFPSGGDGKSHPGDMKIADLDGSGDINNGDKTLDNHGDMKVIGNSAPRFIYSITLGADWNNIFVSAFFQGVGKQDWYPSSESLFWGQYNRTYNQLPTWHLDNYWTEDNRDAYLPRYVGYTTINAKAKESRYLQSVAYIRLKNLQVGYTLPKKWLSKAGIEKLSIYFSGENLWCWSPLYRHTRDLDVMNATHGTDSELGKRNDESNNGNNYPIMRSYSLGVQLTF